MRSNLNTLRNSRVAHVAAVFVTLFSLFSRFVAKSAHKYSSCLLTLNILEIRSYLRYLASKRLK